MSQLLFVKPPLESEPWSTAMARVNGNVTVKISRTTILTPDEGDAPRTRRDLNALHALGAVLNKRDWWTKWTTQLDVHDKWLGEIGETLVATNLTQVLAVWPPFTRNNFFNEYTKIVSVPIAQRAAKIQEVLEDVLYYPPPDGEGEYYDKLGEFSAIADQEKRYTEESVERIRSLMLQVLAAGDGSCTLDVIRAHFPHEPRSGVLSLLCLHFVQIQQFLAEMKNNVSCVLNLLIQRYALLGSEATEPSSAGKVRSGPEPKTCVSDSLIANDLKARFTTQVWILENVPEEEKDWHPHSNNQVLDLVHPSLFCGIHGVTKMLQLVPPRSVDNSLTGTAADNMRAIMFAPTTSILTTQGQTEYQWLPCDIDVDAHGQATIRSYINNLHPEIHPGLYDSITSIFSKFVPLFDTVLPTLRDFPPKCVSLLIEDAIGGSDAPTSLRRLAFSTMGGLEPTAFTLKGRRCQVIVKIAEIVLTPEQPEYAGGAWHVEGTDAEKIVATGLYYFGCENITESRVSFRGMVQRPFYHPSIKVGVGLTYGLRDGNTLTQTLGSVTALEDRCIVFSNIYQHKVEPFRLVDPTKPGTRKILAFFLVNPTDKPIPSTAVVPPQQQAWVDWAMQPVAKRMRLPDGVTQQIRDLTRDGMSVDQARGIRLELMEERSAAAVTEDGDDDQMGFSLCEH